MAALATLSVPLIAIYGPNAQGNPVNLPDGNQNTSTLSDDNLSPAKDSIFIKTTTPTKHYFLPSEKKPFNRQIQRLCENMHCGLYPGRESALSDYFSHHQRKSDIQERSVNPRC